MTGAGQPTGRKWHIKRLGKHRHDWAAVSPGGKVEFFDQRGRPLCAINYGNLLRAHLALNRQGFERLKRREVDFLASQERRRRRLPIRRSR